MTSSNNVSISRLNIVTILGNFLLKASHKPIKLFIQKLKIKPLHIKHHYLCDSRNQKHKYISRIQN